ncbi:MAG: hypothetical protein IT366_16355 [Candidatus Hydrogenedentes bacterium]|nr:hypothetical protein [Candidatus Hydrogenedentota bacterium]
MPKADARIRYLATNFIVWVIVAGLCLGVLAAARRFGMNWTQRQHALSLVANAEGALLQGKFEVAQAQLAKALSLTPSLWPDVSRQLGPQLAGLPSVLETLERLAVAGEIYGEASAWDKAQITLLRGDLESARTLLETSGYDEGRSSYALAQVQFEQGDYAAANKAFGSYWNARVSERDRAITLIDEQYKGKLDGLGQSLWLFLLLGLWDEAFQRADAREAESLAEGQLLRALKADLAGDREFARESYSRALAMRPNILICMRRLAQL